jgi:signal transduction histidine kinase
VAELLAVAREALSNIARHARATRATVTLDGEPGELRLELADDGRGFDARGTPNGGHHGLANMRARIEALGGRFEVDSGNAGTRIIVSVPRRWAPREGESRT